MSTSGSDEKAAAAVGPTAASSLSRPVLIASEVEVSPLEDKTGALVRAGSHPAVTAGTLWLLPTEPTHKVALSASTTHPSSTPAWTFSNVFGSLGPTTVTGAFTLATASTAATSSDGSTDAFTPAAAATGASRRERMSSICKLVCDVCLRRTSSSTLLPSTPESARTMRCSDQPSITSPSILMMTSLT